MSSEGEDAEKYFFTLNVFFRLLNANEKVICFFLRDFDNLHKLTRDHM
jgi:hypothetical protein